MKHQVMRMFGRMLPSKFLQKALQNRNWFKKYLHFQIILYL